jgi:AraC family transcriptional regulator
MQYLERVQSGIDYIEENLDKPMSLTEISAHADMSHWHFQRIFKALTNETLKSYVRSRRIANSMDTLFDKSRSILDVAVASGFESHESYTRAFQRLFGYSPSDYRDQAQQRLITKKPRFDQCYLENLNKNISLEPRFYTSKERVFVGIKSQVKGVESDKANIAEKLPELWEAFIPRVHEIDNVVDGTFYGVISVEENHEGHMRLHYMACAEVSSVCNLPLGMASTRLEKQDYAEFRHTGKSDEEDFNQTISYIYSSWLLQSNKKHTYAPDIETYGPEFKYQSSDSIVYYAVPIAPIN